MERSSHSENQARGTGWLDAPASTGSHGGTPREHGIHVHGIPGCVFALLYTAIVFTADLLIGYLLGAQVHAAEQ